MDFSINNEVNRYQQIRHLHRILVGNFSLDQIHTIVFDLGVDWDELPGQTKSAKSRELIVWLDRHGRISDLEKLLQSKSFDDDTHKSKNTPYQFRLNLIQAIRQIWVEGLLENLLHDVIRLELGLKYNLMAVERPWQMTLMAAEKADQNVPPGKTILDLFKELNGYMLILGEPGSGKTTTLLELARDLLDIAEDDFTQPVPLIFNLASWAQDRQPLIDWLVKELNITYGIPIITGRRWLIENPTCLLLDGLDEVAPEHRSACIQAINTHKVQYGLHEHGHTSIVASSRKAEYFQLRDTVALQMQGSIIINPLSPEQIEKYLTIGGNAMHTVRQALQADKWLSFLATAPLFLNVITLVYHDREIDKFTAVNSEQRQRQLWSAYINRAFERRLRSEQFAQHQAVSWLSFLAGQMKQRNQTEFLFDQLRPDWFLSRYQKFIVTLIIGLLISFPFTVVFGLILVPFGWMNIELLAESQTSLNSFIITYSYSILFLSLAIWLMLSLFFMVYYGNRIGHADFKPYRRIGIHNKVHGIIAGLIVWWTISFFCKLSGAQGEMQNTGLIIGLIFAMFIGLFFGLKQNQGSFERLKFANQSLLESRRNALLVGLFFGTISALIFWLVFGFIENKLFELNQLLIVIKPLGLVLGLMTGMMLGLEFGGTSYIYNYLLRYFLYRYGYLPKDLDSFCLCMSEFIILRPVGGAYIFLHGTLRDYFASLTPQEIQR